MDRINQYKQKHVSFGSVRARMLRAQKIEERRKEQRAEHLCRFRNDISKNDTDHIEAKVETQEDRMTRLKKWKAERDLKKKLEAKKKQPIFKIGIPHNQIYSSTAVDSSVPHCHRKAFKQCHQIHPSPPKRVTRATEKRLAAKQATLPKCEDNKINIIPEPKKITKVEKKMGKKQIESIAPKNYVFEGPRGIDPLPMFGQIWIPLSRDLDNEIKGFSKNIDTSLIQCKRGSLNNRHSINDSSTKILTQEINVKKKVENGLTQSNDATNVNISESNASITHSAVDLNETPTSCSPVPAEFSPYIVASRGKSGARKEQRLRLGLNDSVVGVIPTKDTVMQNLNISIEEEERTAQYYKLLLKQQIDRLTDVCAEWEKIQHEPETTEDGKYMINQAIGQANLLMQKKFERFRGLVLDCETGKGEMLVRCRDLQAFWDIILMQVKDCDARFEKLSKLKDESWIENDVQVSRVEKKPTGNKKKKITGKSNARAFIEAARKKKLELTCSTDVNQKEDNSIRSDTATPEQNNLSTPKSKIQSSKKMEKLLDTSFTVMKVSRMGKTPEIKSDNTIQYINSNQTPGKGILKRSEVTEKDDILQKPTYKVIFNEPVSTSKQSFDEESYNKFSGGIEKRLNFDDESFIEENQNIVSANIDDESSTSNVGHPLILDTKSQSEHIDSDSVLQISLRTPRKTRAKLSEVSMNDTPTLNMRVLRNREIITDNLPVKKHRSFKKKNSFIEESHENIDNIIQDNESQRFNQRRSTRRSVKFDIDEDCTTCAMNKTPLPMTPRRNKKLSLLGDTTYRDSVHIPLNGDLISFDSPSTPRRRRSRKVNNKN